jgi:hypothetical protein
VQGDCYFLKSRSRQVTADMQTQMHLRPSEASRSMMVQVMRRRSFYATLKPFCACAEDVTTGTCTRPRHESHAWRPERTLGHASSQDWCILTALYLATNVACSNILRYTGMKYARKSGRVISLGRNRIVRLTQYCVVTSFEFMVPGSSLCFPSTSQKVTPFRSYFSQLATGPISYRIGFIARESSRLVGTAADLRLR